MSPAARQALATRTAQLHNAMHGAEVVFRGVTLRVNLAPIAISMDLTTGGMSQGGQFSCRFLTADLTAPPKRGESLLFAGRTYLIAEVHENAPVGQYIATITPGSLQ